MTLEDTLTCLLGFAGVGKYTVAKELHRLTGARIVDNPYILCGCCARPRIWPAASPTPSGASARSR
ncbi:hypothetical protein [Calidithermus chliarophilus]|uniref:hypothetical protein n=1 Tax=Calidithermus chliarophilus TaxID=52023 RepID=UPI0012F63385|nr:hypothetical protein [Calidithermus chliarophilus]